MCVREAELRGIEKMRACWPGILYACYTTDDKKALPTFDTVAELECRSEQ